MFDKVICPYCFTKFWPQSIAFRCQRRTCDNFNEPDTALLRFYGKVPDDNIKGHIIAPRLRITTPQSGKCDVCSGESHTMVCPQCHNSLPRQLVEGGGRIIAIVGARNSGKSNFITVLIDQLQRQAHLLGDIGVLAIDYPNSDKLSTTRRYNAYRTQLYDKGECIEATATLDELTRVPLIYKLSQKGRKPTFLVLYDTAGENFANIIGKSYVADGTAENADVKFLQAADAIIYLLDTFTIEAVHDKLAGKMRLAPIGPANPRYDDILGKLIQYFDEELPKPDRNRLKRTPIAFAFSKFDAVLDDPDLSRALPNMNKESDSEYLDGNGVDISTLDAQSDIIDAALSQIWHENNFLQNVKQFFENYHFFGFSALGGVPDRNNRVAGGRPRPYRVLDPLVWVLSRLNYSFKLK